MSQPDDDGKNAGGSGPTANGGLPVKPGMPRRSRRALWLVGGSIATVVLAGTCISMIGSSTTCVTFGEGSCTSPQQQASEAAAENARQASLGGPPPATCGGAPVPVHARIPNTIWEQASFEGIAVGRAPVWLQIQGLSLEAGRAVEHLADIPGIQGAVGIPVYLEWITDADFTDVIHVRLSDQGTGVEVGSQPGADMHHADLLDPAESKAIAVGPVPPYRIFVESVTIPTSPGCYVATASWLSDSWSVTIAVGR